MKIILHTENNPLDNAMLQALYSRSPESVTTHIEKLKTVGSGKFMSQYYVGYGHESIGDCGFVTMYFEGVSMLAAVALEDFPLFNGQECSSRYIDFSNQAFYGDMLSGPYVPWIGDQVDKTIIRLARANSLYREMYMTVLKEVRADLEEVFANQNAGKSPNAKESKALDAKAFDVARGFLPASATTNVAMTTSLRKMRERFVLLSDHPLHEIRELAKEAYSTLAKAYPEAFSEQEAVEINKEFIFDPRQISHFYNADLSFKQIVDAEVFKDKDVLKKSGVIGESIATLDDGDLSVKLHQWPDRDYSRQPRHSNAARKRVKIYTEIDFGSFRDLHRHRNGYCSNALLGVDTVSPRGEKNSIGFFTIHSWYLNQLNPKLREFVVQKFSDICQELSEVVHDLSKDPETKDCRMFMSQYFFPLGQLVPVLMDYDIAQTLYVAKLRSQETVHATLRPFAQSLGEHLKKAGYNCKYDESDVNLLSLKRAEQDITEKKN